MAEIRYIEPSDSDRLETLLHLVSKEASEFLVLKADIDFFDGDRFPTVLVAVDSEDLIALCFLEVFSSPHKQHVNKLGMYIKPAYRSKGLGSKLCQAARQAAIDRGIEKLWMSAHADNRGSIGLALQNGFKREGYFKNEEKWNGRSRDIVSMAIYLT